MNRLRRFILIFLVTTSVPLAFVIYQSYNGLKQEEQAQLRFFSATLFDQIERDLATLIQTEELRAVDEYQHFLAGPTNSQNRTQQRSPLAEPNGPGYILAYFQNNPDGSMQTPLVSNLQNVPEEKKDLVTRLVGLNKIFNQKKILISQPQENSALVAPKVVTAVTRKKHFSERFLKQSEPQETSEYLGKKVQRIEEISEQQVRNVVSEDRVSRQYGLSSAPGIISSSRSSAAEAEELAPADNLPQSLVKADESEQLSDAVQQPKKEPSPARFQVEVAPFQSVALNDDQIFVFRRIVISNQIYRQGFVVLIKPLVQNLTDRHFSGQPLADFTTLTFQRRDQGAVRDVLETGDFSDTPRPINRRIFPAPFDFLSVSLATHTMPLSPARRALNVALAVLSGFMFFGLVAIYQSARSIVALSERRSQFVSSVTHELKTPLTNIRMYIEMLEQGVAASPQREQEYLRVLAAESARLSRLINNVLELAKLEKKQRNFHLQKGCLDDVLDEVETIMAQKISREGFTLAIKKSELPVFSYDREVLIQILVNLIENSIKFGRNEAIRQITILSDRVEGGVRLALSDTGPGIPRRALKKVFGDFYRVDNALTRKTGGTGIGLALVKKFVSALGGSVKATNNDGPGCTITIVLPLSPKELLR